MTVVRKTYTLNTLTPNILDSYEFLPKDFYMPSTKVRSILLESTLVPNLNGMCELVLVRHGEQALGPTLTAAESHDPPLSELGRQQVGALTARLETVPIDAIFASPLSRAFETGLSIGQARGIAPTVMEGLAEFNPWAQLDQNLPFQEQLDKEEVAEIFRAHSRLRRWDVFRYSEDLDAFRGRVIGAMEDIITTHDSQRVIVACHSGVINTYLSHLWGASQDLLVRVHHTSLTVVRGADIRRAVISVNDHAHVLPFQSFINSGNL
jgi:probable phosphoglycerate mutase